MWLTHEYLRKVANLSTERFDLLRRVWKKKIHSDVAEEYVQCNEWIIAPSYHVMWYAFVLIGSLLGKVTAVFPLAKRFPPTPTEIFQ